MVNGSKRKDDIIHINNSQHAQLIAERLQKFFHPYYDICISRTLDNHLLGGVLYQHYTGVSVSMHVASVTPRWLTRNGLYVAFHYPFEQLKVKKVIGIVPEDNPHALVFDLKLGFQRETALQDVVPGGGVVILSMTREQCRWLNHNPRGLVIRQHSETPHGQSNEGAAAARFH